MKGSCFKRACRAIKGTFSRSRKTKVVPLDPDPSDLQPDPTVQTHLCVFEPVVVQEIDDFLLGSCNWEKTPLEDPDDPQAGPSGVLSAPPEKPADSQPGSSNLEQTSLRDPDVLQQAASGLEPSAPQDSDDPKSGSGLEPTASEKPADYRPEQQTKRRKEKKSRACFKRAWRAMKGTFSRSRKNKVAPFSSPSDPDPSDLQPDPIVQTNMCVFEPMVLQDIDDFLPGSCNSEQTPLEDPVDPQPGPSGLEPTAPEEPADHQPEQQTKEDQKKKKHRSCFKRAWRAIKGTFSRSRETKVVPFVPDPSDLQPDPTVQTQLRVFEPVSVQDPDDFITVSCNWEQTPQPGPSGVQSTAPNKHQTSRSFSSLYKVLYNISSGSTCSVYWGIRRSDGQEVTIKIIDHMNYTYDIYVPGHSKPEPVEVAINLMLQQSEKCPYIMEILDWFKEKDQLIIIMESPEPYITLDKIINHHRRDGMGETLARHFMRQVVIAAKYCIDHGVNHNDLRDQNILVNTKTHQIKLIDFGNSQIITSSGEEERHYCDRAHAVEETVYKLGLLLYYMLRSEDAGLVGVSKACHDLINLSAPLDPDNFTFPTLEEFMDHEWFQQG